MSIKEIYDSLIDKFNITDRKSFKFVDNPYKNLIDKKIPVTEYTINNESYFVDANNNVYQFIEYSICPNLAIKVGHIKKKTMFIYNKYKKN